MVEPERETLVDFRGILRIPRNLGKILFNMQIKQFDILVHPDFYQMDSPDSPLHKRQVELHETWDRRVENLQREQGTAMLYFSNLERGELEQGLHEGANALENPAKQHDISRIQRYQEQLGNRFMLFSKLDLPNRDELQRVFSERGIQFQPDTTRIYPYGEAFEACVPAWGWHIKEELGVPDTQYDLYTESMSLTFADSHEINQWRREQEATRKLE